MPAATKRKCGLSCRRSHPHRVFLCQCKACGGLTHGSEWMRTAPPQMKAAAVSRITMEARRLKLLVQARGMVQDLDLLRRRLG